MVLGCGDGELVVFGLCGIGGRQDRVDEFSDHPPRGADMCECLCRYRIGPEGKSVAVAPQ